MNYIKPDCQILVDIIVILLRLEDTYKVKIIYLCIGTMVE